MKQAVPRRRAGQLSAAGFRFALVVSRFNQFITRRLLDSALDALLRLGADAADIVVIEVPGAFEIPAAARQAAQSGQFHALVCLGLILRGETPHFDYISREVTRGVGQSALETGVPHAFGVLTCDTLEEAVQRAGLKAGNKGWEAALAAVEMAHLFASLQREFAPPAV
ncbi:MAG TPA: 6,7-dimethyl-8-ribityllumazine synthase [Terriglobales bacterium]|nr:6,7-dimethyl-8-ribityllumazine synthase [Terriglobales bacterium]